MLDWIQTHIPPWAVIAIVMHLVVLGIVAYLILLERKIASWAQDRIGPNRVGLGFGIIPFLKNKRMWGRGQPMADGLKFLLKEDYRPKDTDKYLFTIAPMVMIGVVIISIAVIPWGGVHQVTRATDVTAAATGGADVWTAPTVPARDSLEHARAEAAARDRVPWGSTLYADPALRVENGRLLADITYRYPFQIAKLDVGALFIISLLSLAVYGIVLGGWASNNKYSFLGGLRATAQMVSYEIPLGVSLLCVVVMFGTLELDTLTHQQQHYWLGGVIPAWNVFAQSLAFLLFLICIHAEANRAPFDLAEAEQELVGGYHTEYSSMRFALFFLAEYAGMITTSAVCVALFFGGWHIPWVDKVWTDPAFAQTPEVTTSLFLCIVRTAVFLAKVMAVIGVFMWVRWSLPRFRFDQLMMLAWRAMIPMSLGLLLMTALVIYFFGFGRGERMQLDGRLAVALLVGNVAVLVISMGLSLVLPAPPETNRRMKVSGSRFDRTPLPAGVASATGN